MNQFTQATATNSGAKVLYTAKTHTTGGREHGVSRSSDGHLDIRLSTPGTAGTGTNPEQLFAAGWSACFEGAMGIAARKMKIALPADLAIDAEVDLNLADGGYFLAARLNISVPGVDPELAQALVDAAHQTCPYSKALRSNVNVVINVVVSRTEGNSPMDSEAIDHHRRRFFGTAAMTITAAQLGMIGSANAQAGTIKLAQLPTIKPGTNTSFGSLKQIDAGVLNVGYAEAGPADGPAVILLHGWPYDIHTYVDVAPLLASAGYRVIVPYLRGYGTTRFLSDETARNGQQSVIAVDIIALMDALKIEKATIAGCDWGARTANIIAALWPERCKAMVSVSGYLIGSRETNKMPLPPKAELQWWYQYYFATERGRAGYEKHRHDFAKLIWQIASPQWDFDDATFNRSAAVLRQPGPRQHRDPQLPLAAQPG